MLVDDDAERPPRLGGENLWELDPAAPRSPRGVDLGELTKDPSDVTWCSATNTLLVTDDDELRLYELSLSGERRRTIDLSRVGAKDPKGVACAPELGRIFIADGKARQLIELGSDGSLVARVSLAELPFGNSEGIAWDPASGHLILVSDDPPALFELTREGVLWAAQDLLALGARRPRGLALAPASAGSGTSLYVADAGERHGPDGRILEIALTVPPPDARVRTQLAGDVDGFGFRGDEPGFAQGDLDHDGLLEPGERLPQPPVPKGVRDPADPPTTDVLVTVREGEPLVLDQAIELGGGEPVWARLTLVVGGARALPGKRSVVRADGRLLGELIPTRGERLYPGMIATTVLELPPASLRDLRDGRLRIEIAREPGTGDSALMLDFCRLEVAVAGAAPPVPKRRPLKQGGNS